MCVDEVVGAGHVAASCKFEDLGLGLFSDVHVVVFAPVGVLVVVGVAVVVATICSSFVDE